jgi:AraC-like DNA-binding protein
MFVRYAAFNPAHPRTADKTSGSPRIGALQSVRRGNPNACEQKSDDADRRWHYRLRQRICVKRFNPRRVKVHRSYTVEEVARLFGAHKNTVRNWLKEGLPKVDDRRPILVLGRQLVTFVHERRRHRRQRCAAGELFCFKCRKPRRALAGTAEYLPLSPGSGNLRAVCIQCGTRLYRRVSLRRLAATAGNLQVALPQAQQRIVEGAEPCVGCDLEREPDAQPGE